MSSAGKEDNTTGHKLRPEYCLSVALRDAAIYETMAKHERDPERAARYKRLHEIELGFARYWIKATDNAALSIERRRFSPSLIIFQVAGKLMPGSIISRTLRHRHRRRLIDTCEAIHQAGLSPLASESAELLKRLTDNERNDDDHEEHSYLVGQSGALRAAVLGVNDGLVSNFSLAMGVAGGIADTDLVLLAGLAGLIAGALSMAAGEYISVVSQRDFYADLVRWERTELTLWHEKEEEELVEIYKRKGLDDHEAKSVAGRIMSDPDVALDTHVREELGIDPEDLGGSPWTAAISSFASFSAGALIPILPYILKVNLATAIVASAVASTASLMLVGGWLGWISGIGTLRAALRMLMIGAGAAAVTYVVGMLVGNQIGI